MTRFQSFLFVIMNATALAFGVSSAALSQDKTPVAVSEASLCLDVVDLSCVGENVQFPVEAGKIYCVSKIVGAKSPITISHVWYYNDRETARVPLAVNSSNWRTYSSKRVLPSQVGEWHVDILGPEGELLKKIAFNVTPQ